MQNPSSDVFYLKKAKKRTEPVCAVSTNGFGFFSFVNCLRNFYFFSQLIIFLSSFPT